MSNFAKVVDGLVVNIIVAEQDFIDSLEDKDFWIETSSDSSIRKNYAIIGGTYNKDLDAFIPPKPFDSWMLDEETCLWSPPIEYPSDGGNYIWNEENLDWESIPEGE